MWNLMCEPYKTKIVMYAQQLWSSLIIENPYYVKLLWMKMKTQTTLFSLWFIAWWGSFHLSYALNQRNNFFITF